MYGALIRRARSERQLTQVELARVSGIEQANISAIETGRRLPSAETLHRLFAACGFELIAVAGPRMLALPPLPVDLPPDDHDFDPPDEPSLVTADTPPEVRARLLVAALDASEAILRSR